RRMPTGGAHPRRPLRSGARTGGEAGRRPPPPPLFQGAPTAARAGGPGPAPAPPAPPPLVALATGASAHRPPLYCVHPIGGTVLCYGALARRLGTERTIYALEAPGLHGDGAPENSVEALAALYLEVVRGHRPGGPYFLCGWSFGGVVAYEMARLLVERGERVGLLALIDSRAPGSTPVSSDPV